MDKEPVFEGMPNFRDIGGFILNNGRKMKQGVVFRSEELSRMLPGERTKIKALGIKCIVDLRTPSERSIKPYEMGEDIRIVHVPVFSEEKDLNRWQFFWFLISKGRKLDFGEYMRRFYYRLAFERAKQIKEILTLLADQRNLPVLIHCTGGKDRTGFIAALLQLIVGVLREEVIESYLASGEAVMQQMKEIEKYIRWMSLGQVSPERIRPMLEVRREYLEDTLEEIFRRYKSLDEYLIVGCSMDKQYIENIQKSLTEW